MKYWTLIFAIVIVSNTFGQKPISYIKGGDYEKDLNGAEYDLISHSSGFHCSEESLEIVVLEIIAVAPYSSDSAKQVRIEELADELKALSEVKNCPQVKTIILFISDGLFIKKSDGFAEDELSYANKKYTKLNYDRFNKMFASQIRDAVGPEVTVKYCDFFW